MKRFGLFSICICIAASIVFSTTLKADWPTWRGANRDGLSEDKNLLKQWEGTPPIAWKAKNLGKGFAGVSVAAGKVFTMGDRDGKCQVIALSKKNGKELWAAVVGKPWKPDHKYPGSRCTPTYAQGLVYALSAHGDLVCVSAKSGKVKWRKNFKRDFGGKMMSGWGFSESPLVDGDKLICTPGGNDALMVAFNRKTGKEIWRAKSPKPGVKGRDGAAYSSIVISNGAGVKQYVQLTGRGLIGVEAKTGKVLWTYNRVANHVANIPTPVVRGDYVFGSTGYGTGAALLKLAGSDGGVDAEEVYFLDASTLQNHHGGMLLVGDYIYCGRGNNKGYPACIEFLTGKSMWPSKERGPGRGSAAVGYADGKIYYRYQDGLVALVKATPDDFQVLGKFKIPDVKYPSWPHPVITDGMLYLREQGVLYCHDVRKKR